MLSYRYLKKYLSAHSSIAMSQTLDNLPRDENNKILCCYVNATSQIQIARITNIPNWYFERVVFPGQRLVFESHGSAVLEIHSGMMASAILSDTIPCTKLAISNTSQDRDPSQNTQPAEKKVALPLSSIETVEPINVAV